MPFSEKQRSAAFAEVGRRKKGLVERNFKGMGKEELEDYAHEPLKKKGHGLAKRK